MLIGVALAVMGIIGCILGWNAFVKWEEELVKLVPCKQCDTILEQRLVCQYCYDRSKEIQSSSSSKS